MNACTPTLAAGRPVLLIKALGAFKHSGGYYLHNGRWHKLGHDQKPPKGAPVAAHPKAAGHHEPAKHFSEDEWAKLQLPAENVNAGTYNKQLAALKQHSEGGDLTAILGGSYGTNTYGQKLSKIANHLLGQHGSEHKVTPGQKAGTHAAVGQAPDDAPAPSVTQPAIEEAPKEDGTKQAPDQAQATILTEPKVMASHVRAFVKANGLDLGVSIAPGGGSIRVASKTYEDHITPEHRKAIVEFATSMGFTAVKGLPLNPENGNPNQIDLHYTFGGPISAAAIQPAQAKPQPAAQALAMPTFQEGKTVTGVIAYYEGVAQKILDLAAAGDAAGLDAMKVRGLVPNAKGKVSNTWAGKTENSKTLMALHAQALEQVKGGGEAEQSGTTSEQPGMAVPAQADSAAAEPVKPADAPKLTPKGLLTGANGYAKTFANKAQANAAADKLNAQGHQASVIGTHPFYVKVMQPAQGEAEPQAPGISPNQPIPEKQKKILDDWAAGGDKTSLAMVAENNKTTNPHVAAYAEKLLAGLDTPAEKPPRAVLVSRTKLTPASSSSAATNLAQIPWDKFTLPASNTNAKSHNGKAAKIKAMAEAGDLAGLEAFKAGVNTYGKMQMKLVATAVAALKASNEPAPQSSQGADSTPKEGDTKQGADGTLVFKDGRWHKVGEPEQTSDAIAAIQSVKTAWVNMVAAGNIGDLKEAIYHYEIENASGNWDELIAYGKKLLPGSTKAEPALSNLPQPPEFSGLGGKAEWVKLYAAAAQALHDAVEANGAVGLKGMVTSHKDGTFTIKAASVILKHVGPTNNAEYRKQMHAYVTELKAAAGKAPKKPKAAKQPAPQQTAPAAQPPSMPEPADTIESMDTWAQTGPQGGSNPGGKFKDADGVEWYCKFPADDDIAKSEVLAAKLYAAAGIVGQDAKLVTKGGKLGIASRWVTVNKATPTQLAKTDGVAAGFAVDAWLANWDVVGLGFDNLQVGESGKAVRVDAGGALHYRAQGGKKAFGTTVSELDSLRDPKINPQAAAVFGHLTPADITASVAKVLAVPDWKIKALAEQFGPGDAAAKKAMADTLIARKADLAAKFPKVGKTAKKRLDPNNLPIDPDRLPKAHDFSNWLGTGKPLSSQPHVNAANQAVEQEMIALAKTGNLTKLKEFKFHAIDKATGNATGHAHPIAEHPSKHIVQLHADLVQTLDEVANPPEPLKIFRETDVGSLQELTHAFPPKKFGTTTNSVSSNEKLGFWVVLGGVSSKLADKLKPAKVADYSHEMVQAGHAKYKTEAHGLAKHFINSVQASGTYNDLFRNGKETDGHGNKLSDVAQAALGYATSQPEGTSLYRWQNMSDDMVKKVLSAPDGSVFQATGPMCTSYSPNATSGFGQHRVVVRYAKGAKAVESFGSGAFSGEKEVTTLPNSRFVILSKKMVPNEKSPGKQRLELEVLMLPPDLGL